MLLNEERLGIGRIRRYNRVQVVGPKGRWSERVVGPKKYKGR